MHLYMYHVKDLTNKFTNHMIYKSNIKWDIRDIIFKVSQFIERLKV